MRRLPVAEPDERPWRSFDALDEWASASGANTIAVFVLIIASAFIVMAAVYLVVALLVALPWLIPAVVFLLVAWALTRLSRWWEQP